MLLRTPRSAYSETPASETDCQHVSMENCLQIKLATFVPYASGIADELS